MVTRRDKWAAELERAKRLLEKARREVREYERRHAGRLGV
jgi:F0F1-type ATP synthase membrane subunit b/b'